MATFTVTFREVAWHEIAIEAEDEDTAEALARDRTGRGGNAYETGREAELAAIRNHATGEERTLL